MIGSDRARARVACCTIVMTLGAGVACDEFPRTNPFDAAANVTLVVSGPDSVTAIGDTVTFEVRTPQGESLDQLANWGVPTFLRATGVRNQFVAVGLPASARGSGNVVVQVNANVVTKPFLFAQQARSLSVAACDGGGKIITFTSFLAASDPALDAEAVCSRLLDRRENPVPNASTTSGVIRDPSVARFVSPNQQGLNALSVGSTYVVYSGSGFIDSIRVDVRQDFAGLWPDPPGCLTLPGVVLSPGQTLQVTAVPSDEHGNPIVDSVVARAALVGLSWGHTPALNVTVSSSGLVTAIGPSDGYVIAEKPVGQPVLYCPVSVK